MRTAFAESITSSTQSPGGQQNPVVAPVYATNVTPYSPASAKFNSVSCSTPGDCTAVGDYTNAANDETAMSAVEANGAWGAITPTVFAAGTQNSTPLSVLNSVSCAGPLDCTAVGIVMDPHTHMQPFSMTLTKGTWTRARVAVFARGAQDATPQAAYSSVSCTSPGNCTAVGAYNIGSSPSKKFQVVRGFADLQTNGTWATVTPSIFHHGIEASPYADYFISVSCAQASFCTATGQYEDAQGGIHPFLESSIGGVWRPAVVAKVASSIQYTTPDSAFAAVSCPQVGRCAAVGYYSNTSDSSQGLSEFTSGPPPSTVSASVVAGRHVVGSPLSVRAHVLGHHPTGRVLFTLNGAAIAGCASRVVTHSLATCVTSRIGRGHHVIAAVYLGDAANGPSMGSASLTVLAH